MTPERTREVITAYLEGHDVSRIAEAEMFIYPIPGQFSAFRHQEPE